MPSNRFWDYCGKPGAATAHECGCAAEEGPTRQILTEKVEARYADLLGGRGSFAEKVKSMPLRDRVSYMLLKSPGPLQCRALLAARVLLVCDFCASL